MMALNAANEYVENYMKKLEARGGVSEGMAKVMGIAYRAGFDDAIDFIIERYSLRKRGSSEGKPKEEEAVS